MSHKYIGIAGSVLSKRDFEDRCKWLFTDADVYSIGGLELTSEQYYTVLTTGINYNKDAFLFKDNIFHKQYITIANSQFFIFDLPFYYENGLRDMTDNELCYIIDPFLKFTNKIDIVKYLLTKPHGMMQSSYDNFCKLVENCPISDILPMNITKSHTMNIRFLVKVPLPDLRVKCDYRDNFMEDFTGDVLKYRVEPYEWMQAVEKRLPSECICKFIPSTLKNINDLDSVPRMKIEIDTKKLFLYENTFEDRFPNFDIVDYECEIGTGCLKSITIKMTYSDVFKFSKMGLV